MKDCCNCDGGSHLQDKTTTEYISIHTQFIIVHGSYILLHHIAGLLKVLTECQLLRRDPISLVIYFDSIAYTMGTIPNVIPPEWPIIDKQIQISVMSVSVFKCSNNK